MMTDPTNNMHRQRKPSLMWQKSDFMPCQALTDLFKRAFKSVKSIAMDLGKESVSDWNRKMLLFLHSLWSVVKMPALIGLAYCFFFCTQTEK